MTERKATARLPRAVTVTACARLHMGFLDLNGGLGRQFGSIGLALEDPGTRLRLTPARRCGAEGPDAQRARALLARLFDHFGLEGGAHARIESAIPGHAGFGSGTQLALALGAALARLRALGAAPAVIASLLDRGARSGVGLGTFRQGGFVVDGGHRGDSTPPVISRLPFPPAWRLLLVLDRRRHGVHGASETGAFRELPAFPAETAGHLCRLVLMRVLPALAEEDVATFGAGITEIQQRVGDHFASAQGGRYASPDVAAVLTWLAHNGAAGVGQSSWGPTGFAVCASEAAAADLARGARAAGLTGRHLEIRTATGRNRGADIAVEHDDMDQADMDHDDIDRDDSDANRTARRTRVEEGETQR